MPTCTRKLEFDAGHRVLGHAGKCRYPHGHRYVVEVTAEATLDSLGMVIDFGDLKSVLGSWIDEHLDHGFIVNTEDIELINALESLSQRKLHLVDFNPTAENLAWWLLKTFQNMVDVKLTHVRIYETPNCWADAVPNK